MTTISAAAARLRDRYLEGLPSRWQALEAALTEHERAPTAEARAALRALAHQIRGSAASFGFYEVDRAAYALEHGRDDAAAVAEDGGMLIAALRRAHTLAAGGHTEILLIDDDPSIGFLLKALLAEEQLSITQVTTAAAAIDELNSSRWAVIFVDLILPDADGRTLLTRVRDLPAHRDTPLIVLSARTGALIRNECRMYGIDAFLEKPIDRATFSLTVAGILDRARSLRGAANLDDPLTRLPNRIGFRRAFDALPASARTPLTIAVLDVDGFKALVDGNGQHVGDRALRLLAQSLRQHLAAGDLLARWASEEFIVAFPGTTLADAVTRLEAAAEVLRLENLGLNVGDYLSFSAGVTALAADEALDFALLRADQLLYQAKRGGRGRLQHVFERAGDQRPRLLIAEDDPSTAALLFRDLADDFDIHHVPRGDLAITAAAEHHFDLVLLDYQMPGKNGVEVVHALRAMPDYDDRPILLLTTVGNDAAVEAAFDAGADDYINKPHSRRALLARLSRHLGRAPRRSPITDPPSLAAVETEITTLFCDISDFSQKSASMSPTELVEMINTYFPSVAEIIARQKGRLEKYIGDALLAVWGDKTCSDGPQRAVRAAVEIQQAIQRLAKTCEPAIHVHIGLHSGPVASSAIDDNRRMQPATGGGNSALVTQICSAAGPDEIALSPALVERLGETCPWPIGAAETVVRGDDEVVVVHRLRWMTG